MNLKLLKVSFGVRPTPSHPFYYEWQFGFLTVFLYDVDVQNAEQRAYRIVSQLPCYELTEFKDGFCKLHVWEKEGPVSDPKRLAKYKSAEQNAQHLGIAFFLDYMETGTTEPKEFFSPPSEDMSGQA